ncbi:MAG: UDP-N-acetylglucosamine 1-carboxyvinyltransferase [Lachnospiraceae bacterium]|nr:UDP-N-acetylglucosamine 1-carboxyvinyltransferase [Lachnospiraceae bacterium]
MREIISVHGGRRLSGTVAVDGSKNSALACLAAACLVTDGEPVVLENVPAISDVAVMCDIIRELGKDVTVSDGKICVSGDFLNSDVPKALAGKIRGSMYFLGVLAAAAGEFHCGFPGGDQIGERPIDIHLAGLQKMGVDCEVCDGIVEGKVSGTLTGCRIYLRYPSVGATCNMMLAASRAAGRTVIENAAREPEIVDLGNLLSAMGVRVSGAGTDRITVTGTESVRGGISYEIIADRIEAGMFAIATAICGGSVRLDNIIPYHSFPLISLLCECGVTVEEDDNSIVVISDGRLQPFKVEMMPFPGVATDLQPAVAVMASCTQGGISTITDLVFQNRFQYIEELKHMGARIEHMGNKLEIRGGLRLHGCRIHGGDIRAVSALLLAGLSAEGETQIEGVEHLRRGYPQIDAKFRELGADVAILKLAE